MPSLDIVIPARNAAARIDATLRAIFEQRLPAGLVLGVIVVDAASTDATAEITARHGDRGVRRVTAGPPAHRAAACNAGVGASRADYVLLLDADCRLADADCLAVAAAAMADGVDAGFGFTTGTGEGVLARLQAKLERQRRQEGWTGWTTACCLLRRELFEALDGFSPDYTHYGFEDRDLICRLRARADARLRALPGLRAVHEGPESLGEIRDKMYTAGRHTSGVFRRRFPAAYAELPYTRIDAATASTPVRVLLGLGSTFEPLLARLAAGLLRCRRLPLAIGAPLVRLVSALAFYRGTRDRDRGR